MAQQIQLRRDTSATWTSANPVLAQGEVGFEIDTGNFKIGDGSTAWTSLSYFEGTGESNTASNVGVTGVGVFYQKTGVDLELRKIDVGSTKLSVALNTDRVVLDVVPGNINHQNLGGAGSYTHSSIDNHINNSANPHGTKLDDLATPDDNTDLDVSTARHGLFPKLSGNASEFLNGVGAWVSAGGVSDITIPIGGFNKSSFELNGTSWQVIRRFIFKGTTITGTPLSFKVIASTDSGDYGDVRLYDLTNVNQIGIIENINGVLSSIYTTSSLSNLPSGESIFEIQGRSGGVPEVLYISEFVLTF